MPASHPVEPLEPRRLCAASVTLVNHILIVTANPTVDSTVTVGLSADGGAIVGSVTYTLNVPVGGHGRGATYPLPQTVSQRFPLGEDIRGVRINGGAGDDTITIDQTNGSFQDYPATIQGGAGNDTVHGGDESDRISGGAGFDSLDGGAGNDTLFGQQGDDVLIGGIGNDYLAGMRGHDSLVGGDGNDTLQDPFGPDTVLGGAGDNVFNLRSLKRDVDNDFDKARDKLHIIDVPGPPDDGTTLGGLLGGLFPVSGLL